MTIAELTVLAQQIRDETQPGANTAIRIGDCLQAIIDTLAERTPLPQGYFTSGRSILNLTGGFEPQSRQIDQDFPYLIPFYIQTKATFDQLQMWYQSRLGTGTTSWALYNSADFLPTTRITGTEDSFAPAAAPAIPTNTFTAPIELEAGLYFVAVLSDIGIEITGSDEGPSVIYFDEEDGIGLAAGKFKTTLISDDSYVSLPASFVGQAFTPVNEAYLFSLRLD